MDCHFTLWCELTEKGRPTLRGGGSRKENDRDACRTLPQSHESSHIFSMMTCESSDSVERWTNGQFPIFLSSIFLFGLVWFEMTKIRLAFNGRGPTVDHDDDSFWTCFNVVDEKWISLSTTNTTSCQEFLLKSGRQIESAEFLRRTQSYANHSVEAAFEVVDRIDVCAFVLNYLSIERSSFIFSHERKRIGWQLLLLLLLLFCTEQWNAHSILFFLDPPSRPPESRRAESGWEGEKAAKALGKWERNAMRHATALTMAMTFHPFLLVDSLSSRY